MDVSQRVVDFLRAESHDAVHLRDQGLQRLPNGEIFRKAQAEKRVILTFDLDFGEIVASASKNFSSVVIFRLHDARSDQVIGRLKVVLEKAAHALNAGAIVVVQESRLRIRMIPIF